MLRRRTLLVNGPHPSPRGELGIGFLNDLFYVTGAISRDRQRCQFLFCFLKNPLLYWSDSAGERSGGARKIPYGAVRSH